MTQAIAYRCTPDVIRDVIAPGKIGAYALGNMENEEFSIKYIGRSDKSLRNRLLSHNYMYHFDYFIFQCTTTVEEAFKLEAKWWHSCRMNHVKIVNRIHPDSPNEMNLRCPYCNFSYHLSQLLNKRTFSNQYKPA